MRANRDLVEAIRAGHSREDLSYRLNVVAIALPPLRQCQDDIPALAHFYVQRFAAETKKLFTGLAPEVQARLLAYPWPGNMRELANVIERAVVLGEGPQITLQDLPPSLVGPRRSSWPPSPPTLLYHDATVAFQRTLLHQALAQAQGNQTAAARALRLQRTSFQRLLNSLGLRSPH